MEGRRRGKPSPDLEYEGGGLIATLPSIMERRRLNYDKVRRDCHRLDTSQSE